MEVESKGLGSIGFLKILLSLTRKTTLLQSAIDNLSQFGSRKQFVDLWNHFADFRHLSLFSREARYGQKKLSEITFDLSP